MNTTNVYATYLEALKQGESRRALQVAQTALDNGLDIRDLYMDVFQRSMHEIGHLWESNQITVAQEHLATAITQSVMARLYSYVFSRPPLGLTMVATCIGGELHELGIRMVADFFEMEGWDVLYLGANMPTDDIVTLLDREQPNLLCISASLNSHVLQARDLIHAVRATPFGENLKIMVGGHPFNRNPHLCDKVGADFTAPDARTAVNQAMMEVSAC